MYIITGNVAEETVEGFWLLLGNRTENLVWKENQ